MKVKPIKIIKSCSNCKYQNEDRPYTCDYCDTTDNRLGDYYMWEYKKPTNRDILKIYNEMEQISQGLSRMKQCLGYVCGNTDTPLNYLNK